MRFRDRVRMWLFGEEIQAIATLRYEFASQRDLAEQGIHHDSMLLAQMDRMERKLDAQPVQMDRIEHRLNELAVLLEPAAKLAQRKPVSERMRDWDQVQFENVKDFQEKANDGV